MSKALRSLVAMIWLLGPLVGCQVSRPPLVSVEPDYAYTRDPGVGEAGLARFYPLTRGADGATARLEVEGETVLD